MDKQSWAIGIDIGGTKIYIGMVDSTGKVSYTRLIKTRVKEGPKAVIDDIAIAFGELQQEASGTVLCVGIGMAAQIEKLTGVVRFAPNLGWRDFPLKAELSQKLGRPVWVTNDVRAATWGEWLHGAGQGCDDLLCVFVGTGIGGGVVSNGNIVEGCSNTAGEIGHITIDMHGPKCSCGNYGCFEALAAGWAITRRAKEVISSDKSQGQALLDLAGGDLEAVTTKHVYEGYHQGVPLAKKIIQETKEALVAGIAGLVNAFNPQRVILGGGIINAFPEFVEAIRQGVPTRALKAAVEPLEILPSRLLSDAGIVGAAAFAMACTNQKGAIPAKI